MIRTTIGTATLALACSLAIGANAQLVTIKQLSLPIAATIATTAMETCKAQGYNVSVHIIGNMGEVLVALRGDNTGPHTMENSMRKALTSRGTRLPSGEFAVRPWNTIGSEPSGPSRSGATDAAIDWPEMRMWNPVTLPSLSMPAVNFACVTG